MAEAGWIVNSAWARLRAFPQRTNSRKRLSLPIDWTEYRCTFA